MEKFDQHLPILSRTIRNKYKLNLKKKTKSCGETDFFSDTEIDGNYADQSSDSYSNSFSSNILTENMEQEVGNLYRILEHPYSDQERPEIENLPNDKINADEDCVIKCENDYPSNLKTSKNLNKCLEIKDKLISNKSTTSTNNFRYEMSCSERPSTF